MKKISIVTPCFNEEENVFELYLAVKNIMQNIDHNYIYKHIFIDNCSTDNTANILRKIANEDNNIKVIINSRNFGHFKSPIYGIFQSDGDATILLCADFQDPPSMILDFIKKFEEGFEIVIATKTNSLENSLMYKIRNLYYNLLASLSEVKIYKNFTGFGLYSKRVISEIKNLNDPHPFFRGMIAEVGYKSTTIDYIQPARKKGFSKNNFYHLYDLGILGIISNSKIPLRIAVFTGAIFSILSLFIGFGYFIAKLIFWDKINLGIAPLIIMSSLMFSVLLFFIGVIGEYVGEIYTQVLNRPLVHEQERINF
jgi:glycosyltransferase involved in cell wall biosynthesis